MNGQDMKTEMAMMPNGNYDKIISPIQHECTYNGSMWRCFENGWDLGNLYLKFEEGDPCEDGYEVKINVKYCPFCGYRPDKEINGN